jgi:cytoskeleton protein RodZ
MSSVGSCLREMRLKHGFSLAEIARSTRVTSRYLVALESDQFSELPPAVFTRGFIRAFCTALGESPETALALYDQQSGADGPRRPAPHGEPRSATAASGRTVVSSPPRGRSAVFVSFILLVGLGAALFAVVTALQGGRESTADKPDVAMARRDGPGERVAAVTPGRDRATTSPTSTAPSGVTPSTNAGPPPASGAAAPGTAAPAAAPIAPGAASAGRVSSPYRLVAKTRALTWLRVRTEGGHATEENVPAGQVREWVSNRPFIVTVGNAGGVSFELNGRPLPPLGAEGAVVREFMVPSQR